MTDYQRHPDPKAQLSEILAGRSTSHRATERRMKPERHGCEARLSTPLVLTFPVPPKEVSPNKVRSSHWTATCKAKQRYKGDVMLQCLVENVPQLLLATATVQATFYFKTAARRDADNALGSIKGLLDTLVEHGVFTDDHGLRHEPVVMAKDKANPRLELSISQ